MTSVATRMNPREHCPDCGSLLVTMHDCELCAYCGYEQSADDELSPARPQGSARGEGLRFHTMDDNPELELVFDRAA